MGKRIEDFFKKMTEGEYRANPAVSYSFLKEVLEIGGRAYDPDRERVSSGGFALGSMVDNIITDNDFNPFEHYEIVNVNKDRSGSNEYKKLVNYLIEKYPNRIIEDNYDNDWINEKSKEAGLWKSYKKDEARIKAFDKDEFWDQLRIYRIEQGDKPIISQDDFELGLLMAETLQNHQYSRDIFGDKPQFDRFYQVKIFFRLNGVDVKAMLDVVLIDYENKVIYPKDLKTGSERDFMKNFYKFKYYLQGALYTAALQSIIQTNPEFEEWTVAPFEFIYISRANPNEPLIYQMNETFITKAMTGFITHIGVIYKGILDLIDDHKWYIENNITNSFRDIIENNGVIKIHNPF